ncbi:hypothetical protein SD80_008430 [Scytonema tolypothrichoides VB-61278]|nr:hypothetical protein SD80_008430 [Scytonema tolypothrichoides VB-61278]
MHQRDIFLRVAIAQGAGEAIAFTAIYLLGFAGVDGTLSQRWRSLSLTFTIAYLTPQSKILMR